MNDNLPNIVPMDYDPGDMEITVPGRKKPFIRNFEALYHPDTGYSTNLPLRYSRHLIALEFGVADEAVGVAVPKDRSGSVVPEKLFGVWQAGDINDWFRANYNDKVLAHYNLADTQPVMVWDGDEAALIFVDEVICDESDIYSVLPYPVAMPMSDVDSCEYEDEDEDEDEDDEDEDDKPGVQEYYLRVKTTVGTFRLPSCREEQDGECIELGFNWTVFEQPVVLESLQLFAEVLLDNNVIESVALDDEEILPPCDPVKRIPAREVAYFSRYVSLSKIEKINTHGESHPMLPWDDCDDAEKRRRLLWLRAEHIDQFEPAARTEWAVKVSRQLADWNAAGDEQSLCVAEGITMPRAGCKWIIQGYSSNDGLWDSVYAGNGAEPFDTEREAKAALKVLRKTATTPLRTIVFQPVVSPC